MTLLGRAEAAEERAKGATRSKTEDNILPLGGYRKCEVMTVTETDAGFRAKEASYKKLSQLHAPVKEM